MQASAQGLVDRKIETVTCDCGAEYQTGIVTLGPRDYRQHLECPTCEAKRPSPIPAAHRVAELDAVWRRLCPPGYQNTLAVKLPGGMVTASKLEEWRPGKDGRGLLLTGDTRRGKTRLMWLGARQWMRAGVSCAAVDDPTLSVQYSDALGQGQGMYFIEDLIRPQVLLWDDFGKASATPRYRELAYIVIEKRMAALRPMIVTTQLDSAAGCDLFGERDGSALVERLRECCEVIAV